MRVTSGYGFKLPDYGDGVDIEDINHNFELIENDFSKHIYGVSIDLNNPNPFTSVTYTDDAVGMSPGDGWDDKPIFRDIKPCVFKNGLLQYYLHPNNYTLKEDGTVADLSGASGDVMVEFPKIGTQIVTEGNVLKIRITNAPDKENQGFRYYSHTRTLEGDRDKLYIGAYKGYAESAPNRLRSISNVLQSLNQHIGAFRVCAQAVGAGYDLLGFYQMTLLQALFVIRFKSINSKAALGIGNSVGPSTLNTGGTNSNGMYYNDTISDRIKCFGLEDLWGNCYTFIDGLFIDSSTNILTAYKNFNSTGSGYINRGSAFLLPASVSGYMKSPQGTSEKGFFTKELGASTTTYFSDWVRIDNNRVFQFGYGIFGHAEVEAIAPQTYTGCRLMYL